MHLHTLAPAVLLGGALAAQGTPGYVLNDGVGCPEPAAFYEYFAGNAVGDVVGLSYLFTFGGTRYIITNAANVETQLGTNLQLADDQTVVQQLPFMWPIPGQLGQATNQIDISSNGWISPTPGVIPFTGFVTPPTEEEFVKYPRIAGWWDDLDPSVAGGVYFNTLQNPQRVVITWDQVPQFGTNDSNSFQIVLFSNGDFAINWIAGLANTASNVNDALTGFTGGEASTPPGSVDMSAFAPGVAGPYGTPITLRNTPGLPPVLGGSFGLDVNDLPGGTASAVINVGTMRLEFALDRLGMPACTLYTDPLLTFLTTISGSTANLTVPLPATPGIAGATLESQAIVVTPGINRRGALASDRASITLGDRGAVLVSATGSNSFNGDTSGGFFRVENSTGLDITAMTFDWLASSNPSQGTMVFDTNQTGMADRFDGGNSTAANCLGTYRNGSETTTGLDFTTGVASPCDPAADIGFLGTNQTVTGSFRTLDWTFSSFNPGDVLEVDIDTDGGQGISGDNMDGLVVTIQFSDGSMTSGELRTVTGTNSSRAIL